VNSARSLVFEVALPSSLAGKTIAETAIRQVTGCNVIAVNDKDGMHINPDPTRPLPSKAEMILMGTAEAEACFLQQYDPV
jgi:K+/H+ antiporter YhaU regulatory subunit KhtT